MNSPITQTIADHRDSRGSAETYNGRISTTRTEPVREVEFGSGWYHDVAIRESEKVSERKQ